MNMNNLKYSFILLTFFWSFTHVNAQQDPLYTQYMFNGLVLNPAYAGIHESISLAAGTRIQWTGSGSEKPFTNTFSVHSPIQERLAIGATFVDDQIGRTNRDRLNINLAYRIPMGYIQYLF